MLFTNILVPTDGSELSRESARCAIELAQASGARITALFVESGVNTDSEGDLVDPGVLDHLPKGMEKRSKEYLSFVKKHCKKQHVPCKTMTLVGKRPHKAIVEAAEEQACDLIFMASDGLGGIKSLLLGSETQKVLVHAKMPVLVYRPLPSASTDGKSRKK